MTQGQKEVDIYLSPWNHVDDWVHKGHTKLNMFSVFGEQIKRLSSKPSKLNCETDYTQNCIFMPFVDTNSHLKTKPHVLRSSLRTILKVMTNTEFLGPSLREVTILYSWWEVFPTRESVLGLTSWTLSYIILSVITMLSISDFHQHDWVSKTFFWLPILSFFFPLLWKSHR